MRRIQFPHRILGRELVDARSGGCCIIVTCLRIAKQQKLLSQSWLLYQCSNILYDMHLHIHQDESRAVFRKIAYLLDGKGFLAFIQG